MLLKKLVIVDGKSILLDEHYAAVIGVKEESTSLLRSYYKVYNPLPLAARVICFIDQDNILNILFSAERRYIFGYVRRRVL